MQSVLARRRRSSLVVSYAVGNVGFRAVLRAARATFRPVLRVARATFRPVLRVARATFRPVLRVARAVLRAVFLAVRAVLRPVVFFVAMVFSHSDSMSPQDALHRSVSPFADFAVANGMSITFYWEVDQAVAKEELTFDLKF